MHCRQAQLDKEVIVGELGAAAACHESDQHFTYHASRQQLSKTADGEQFANSWNPQADANSGPTTTHF